jgi:hypothetical protein
MYFILSTFERYRPLSLEIHGSLALNIIVMRNAICSTDALIDIIIDLQERGFDHDFILDHEHIRCLQYNEIIPPDDFEILETHYCSDKTYLKGNYILYAIQLRNYHVRGILMSTHKSYTHGMSLHLWQKFNNEISKHYNPLQPLVQNMQ